MARGWSALGRHPDDDATPPLAVGPAAQAVLDALWGRGHAALVVGGAVRDALLGRPTEDWDVATDARPETILEIFPDGTYQNRFGTVQARGVEITTFRRDHRYADHRRPERVTFTDDVYEDLARRDLTINAIGWGRGSPGAALRVVDPADGLSDLAAGIVRAVGDPDARFDEDALRLLRAVRIAAWLGFVVEPRTHAALCAHAPDVAWVSEERIGTEVRRMLSSESPSHAFRLLRDTGILGVVLPELAAQVGRPAQVLRWMPRRASATGDLFDASMALLDAAARLAPGQERLALAALLRHVPEEGEAVVSTVLRRLRIPTRETELVGRLIATCSELDYSPGWGDADVRRFMAQTGPDLVDEVLQLNEAEAVAGGSAPHEAPFADLAPRVAAQRAAGAPLSLSQLAIDGRDLRDDLGLSEGPEMGVILGRLLDAVIDDPALNDRAALLGLARGWLGSSDRVLAHGVGSAE